MNVSKLSDIEAKPIPRALTGFDELDFIYGYSKFPDRIIWGMPQNKISLWAGSSGIGKSRLCIDVAKNYSKMGNKVLYILTEAELEDFGSWAKNTSQYETFYCSGENNLEEIIKIIYHIRPNLLIIDSVNEIEEFESGSKKETRRLINGTENKIGLRKVTNDVGCHTILLGQLNQDGTIKGGTSLPHLVDIALNLEPRAKDSTCCFTVKVGVKHRYGKRDSAGMWCHYEEGVRCVSDERLNDKIWCESHGLHYFSSLAERYKYEMSMEEKSVKKNFSIKDSLLSFLGK